MIGSQLAQTVPPCRLQLSSFISHRYVQQSVHGVGSEKG